ncbi:hypothetical protein CHUAL_007608 [Chamberlinius hualienensis]
MTQQSRYDFIKEGIKFTGDELDLGSDFITFQLQPRCQKDFCNPNPCRHQSHCLVTTNSVDYKCFCRIPTSDLGPSTGVYETVIQYNNTMFILYPHYNSTVEEAALQCKKIGMHLADFHNNSILEFLSGKLKEIFSPDIHKNYRFAMWIGLNKNNSSERWVWSDNVELNLTDKWAPNRPTNNTNNKFASIRHDESLKYLMHDEPYDGELGWVHLPLCELYMSHAGMMAMKWNICIYFLLLVICAPIAVHLQSSLQRLSINKRVNIRPLPCQNTKGDQGICMFVWDCVKEDGVHLGTCVDGFLFGTCCANKTSVTNTSITSTTNKSKLAEAKTTNHNDSTIATNSSNKTSTSTTLKLLTVQAPSKIFKECGISTKLPQMRIVGGKNAKMGDWPWQVSVRVISFFGFSSSHRCGGTIINENFVITAAHCVSNWKVNQLRVRAGEHDFSSMKEPYPHTERNVQRRILHPKYNSRTYENDLALLRLSRSLTDQPNIAPICLPDFNDDDNVDLLDNQMATLTGWGRLSEGGKLPTILQQVNVPIIGHHECQNMFSKSGWKMKITESFLCAGYESGGKDSCQGDSGGPLQLLADDKQWFLAGVISWGVSCAQPNLPGVCTKITKFKPWIMETITANSS